MSQLVCKLPHSSFNLHFPNHKWATLYPKCSWISYKALSANTASVTFLLDVSSLLHSIFMFICLYSFLSCSSSSLFSIPLISSFICHVYVYMNSLCSRSKKIVFLIFLWQIHLQILGLPMSLPAFSQMLYE